MTYPADSAVQKPLMNPSPMTLNTAHGPITLVESSPENLRSLRAALPLGLVDFETDILGVRYGIVMKCGDTEAGFVKQQPPDIADDSLQAAHLANSILIALSLQTYQANGFGGCLLPCLYQRKKPSGVEAGIAYLGSPSKNGIEATEFPFEGSYDRQFGHGFTTQFTHFIRALQKSSRESKISLPPCIGLDHRPRSALGSLEMQFLIHGPDIYCLKTNITETDPLWTALRATGIDRLIHLPSTPTEIPADDEISARG